MARPLRIFVSHSARDRDLTEALCSALRPSADGLRWGYEVLVDQTELKPTVEWPRYLHEWMARCDSAAILLTRDAAESPWVLKEATILAWRRSLDPNFKLFVARFPEADDQLLDKNGFNPLFLSQIQAVGKTTGTAIATVVRDNLGQPNLVPTLFDDLVGRLSEVLDKVGLHSLQSIADKLDVIPVKFKIADGERAQYIEAIARHLVCGVLGRFKGIHELANGLSAAGGAVVRQVLQMVSPYWVESVLAGRLPPLLNGAAPRRAAGVNGALLPQFTAELLVRKAHQPSLEQTVIPVMGGWSGRIVAHVTREICKFMKSRPTAFRTLTNDQIVQRMAVGAPRWYVVLPGIPDPASLDTLIAMFPAVTFLLWTGETLAKDPTHTRVDWLEPELDVKRESAEFDSYTTAEEIIAKLP